MTNETNNITNPAESATPPATPVQDNAAAYILALDELRANTVDKKEYERITAENQQLIDALMKGEKMTTSAPENKPKSITELVNNCFDKETLRGKDNIFVVENILELRNRMLEKGQPEPFASAEVADLLQHCLDMSGGDAYRFKDEFLAHTYEELNPQPAKKKPATGGRFF